MNIFKKWMDANLTKGAIVSKEISQYDGNHTRCLVIRNRKKSTWVYSHRWMIEANMGDVFYYEGFVNMKGNNIVTFFNMAAYDADENIIDWNFYKRKVSDIDHWTKINHTILISDDRIKFISFRLVGDGLGEFCYDDIVLKKIDAPATP